MKERGSIALFFAIFVLPVIFFLLSLSVDLTQYFGEEQKLEEIFDSAALISARNLPDEQKTRLAALEYLNFKGIPDAPVQIETGGDFVALRFEGHADVSFARLFGLAEGVPYFAYSRARTNPLDTFVLIDSGANLAPAVGGNAWGDEEVWPELTLFRDYSPFGSIDNVPNSRALSQQCLNPVSMPMKRAAIRLVNLLSASPSNLVSVGFSPGVKDAVDIIRRTQNGVAIDSTVMRVSSGQYSSNVVCLAAIERELTTLAYQFPQNPYSASYYPGLIVDEVNWTVEESDLSFLSLSDFVWSRATRGDGLTDIDAVLEGMHNELFGGGNNPSRGVLGSNADKLGVVFLGDLPRSNGHRFPSSEVKSLISGKFSRILESLDSVSEEDGQPELISRPKILIAFVIVPNLDHLPSELEVEELRDFFASVTRDLSQDRFRVIVERAPADSNRMDSFLNNVVQQTRTVLISR